MRAVTVRRVQSRDSRVDRGSGTLLGSVPERAVTRDRRARFAWAVLAYNVAVILFGKLVRGPEFDAREENGVTIVRVTFETPQVWAAYTDQGLRSESADTS